MFLPVLAGSMLAVFVAVWIWQNPGIIWGRLGAEEIAQFMVQIQKLPFPEDERPETFMRLRTWLEPYDGKPVYMLNLMRYCSELRQLPSAPEFRGTPEESNARYEAAVQSMLLKLGGYPLYAGTPQGKNIVEHDPDLDDWSRLVLVRYPSRRAFVKLLTYPGYAEIEPYKVMALRLVLTPSRAQLVIPNLPMIVGGAFLVVFLAIG